MSDDENPTIIRIEKGEQAVELVAEQIEKLADAADALLGSRLSRRAIVLLLQDRIGSPAIGRTQINAVLDALPELRRYIK